MLGYEYVTLNNTQVETRRQQLDQAGWQAFAAPIVVLLLVGAYRLLIPSTGPIRNSSSKPSSLQVVLRRVSWTLDNTYINEFGPLHVQLLGLVYAAILLRRAVYRTGTDYMHVTKAFGHVAVSQLPMHYLLSIKSPYSPITLVTGLTHERLNAYHRLFGRILHAFLAAHAIMYMKFFIDINVLSKRIKDWDVRLGLMAFWTVNILSALAIPPIRRVVYYKVFYRSHIVLSAVLLIVLWFHVSYIRVYIGMSGVIWAANFLLRAGASQPAVASCDNVSKDVVRVRAKVEGKHIHPYFPGVHIYLKWPNTPLKTPFTVHTAKALDKGATEIGIVAKVSGGPMTSAFFKSATIEKSLELELEGPYGEAQQYMPMLSQQAKKTESKFLLVAGGVGATYILPIYQDLRRARGSTKNIRVIWVVRKQEDLAWAAAHLATDQHLPAQSRAIVIHVTQPDAKTTPSHVKNEVLKEGSHKPDFDQYIDDFVNERLKPSLQQDGDIWVRDSSKAKQKFHDTVTIMVCGPAGLTTSVRKAVGKHVHDYGRDIRWYEEQYGFGGS